uniref:Uncharacterized protein n=1 Tax=Tanacetum cinerariifolium TaxID=118510 RepID=A0A6L2MXA8_TANCI|nr:hypothetical protein [Tanacetum cinerariifolium]
MCYLRSDEYAYSVCYCDIDLGSDEYAYSVLVMAPWERMGKPTQCDMLCGTFWGTIFLTGLKCYKVPETGHRIKWTNRKCRITIDLYLCHVEEKLIMRKLEGKWIIKNEMRMILKDGTISKFPRYTSSKEEEEKEDEEEEEEENEEEEKE